MAQQDLRRVSFDGLALSEFGTKILETFPNEEGAGLDLGISWLDGLRFVKQFGMSVRDGLLEAIDLAMKAKGWDTDTLYYSYSPAVNPVDTDGIPPPHRIDTFRAPSPKKKQRRKH
jgi:hypothetical protein